MPRAGSLAFVLRSNRWDEFLAGRPFETAFDAADAMIDVPPNPASFHHFLADGFQRK
jgi:hypothetical protein